MFFRVVIGSDRLMWDVLCQEYSLPKLLVIKLTVEILERSIGPVGHVHIPSDV